MRAGGPPVDICVRNVSSRGMLLQAASPPPRGTYVEILLPGHVVVARVVWTKDRRFGIHSRDRINVDAIAGKTDSQAPSGQKTVPLGATYEPRRADVRQRLEKSRRLSAVLEFGFFILCGGAAATMAASTVHRLLSGTLETISGHL